MRRDFESLGPSFDRLLGRDRAGRFHAAKDDPLSRHGGVPVPIRIEARWTLRQPGEECRLRWGQHPRWNVEVGTARALDAGDLIAIPGQVQIHRQDLALREAMFQPNGDHRFVHFGPPPARARGHLTVQQQLRDLLRNRGAAFDDAALCQVGLRGARDSDRVHAGMRPEAAVLGRQGGGHQDWRQVVWGQSQRPGAVAASRLVERLAATVDDERGWRRLIEEAGGQRAEAKPGGDSREDEDRHHRTRPPSKERADSLHARPKGRAYWVMGHRFTSIVVLAVRPKISGVYISSACVGAVRKVPAVVARAT